MPEPQTIDPEVSRAKFERELADYRRLEDTYRRRGWFLLDATFPEVFVMFATPKTTPAAVVAGVVVDFTNYDQEPPSVTFIDPFTRAPLAYQDLRIRMFRRPDVPGATPETVEAMMIGGAAQPTDFIQSNGLLERPFLCLPGVREYHANPAHTGDSWLLHRGSGEGSLAFILDKIWTYGVNPIQGFQIQLAWQGPLVGLQLALKDMPA